MDSKKIAIYLTIILSIIAVLSQTPQFQAIGVGQHTFISGRNVNCVDCHRYDALQDMKNSQGQVYDAHRNAAGNRNYTTYLEVGGTGYDRSAGIIYSNVDSDGNGNDTWVWNGSMWIYNDTARLYDLDLNGNGNIDESEICKLCHNLELMGHSIAVSEVHTVGTRYCDDDRCHGNRAYQYNSYHLFNESGRNITEAGRIISNNKVHGAFYNEALNTDSNKSIYFPSYGAIPGNAAPNNNLNISSGPYTCLGCHSYINISGSEGYSPKFSHSDPSPPRSRYT